MRKFWEWVNYYLEKFPTLSICGQTNDGVLLLQPEIHSVVWKKEIYSPVSSQSNFNLRNYVFYIGKKPCCQIQIPS